MKKGTGVPDPETAWRRRLTSANAPYTQGVRDGGRGKVSSSVGPARIGTPRRVNHRRKELSITVFDPGVNRALMSLTDPMPVGSLRGVCARSFTRIRAYSFSTRYSEPYLWRTCKHSLHLRPLQLVLQKSPLLDICARQVSLQYESCVHYLPLDYFLRLTNSCGLESIMSPCWPDGRYTHNPSTVRPYRRFLSPTIVPSPIA